MDPNTGYSLVLTIFWSLMTILWTFCFYSTIAWVLIVWYLTTFYLKYKFNEIHDSFLNSNKIKNKFSFLKDIEFHKRFASITSNLNKYLCMVIFIVYFIGTPALQLNMYCIHEKSTKFYVRFAAGFSFFSIFSMFFVMNLSSANVIHSAHKPYRLLYDFLIKTRLSIKEKLKVQELIEQLYNYHLFELFLC